VKRGIEDVRVAVYQAFRTTGRAPSTESLAQGLQTPSDVIVDSISELAAQRHLVLNDAGEIVMAHPFSAIPLGFSVMGANTLWWGGCCWDSFALPHLIIEEPDVLVATRCPGCDRAGAWVVTPESPPVSDWLAHFLVPTAQMWDDVVHTCSNQRLFCSDECLNDWLLANGREKGYVMDVATLWRLASRWYEGRFDHGYQRREPAAARDYFKNVGLRGPFWGLADD
jgi:hypothetical protein